MKSKLPYKILVLLFLLLGLGFFLGASVPESVNFATPATAETGYSVLKLLFPVFLNFALLAVCILLIIGGVVIGLFAENRTLSMASALTSLISLGFLLFVLIQQLVSKYNDELTIVFEPTLFLFFVGCGFVLLLDIFAFAVSAFSHPKKAE